MNRIFEVHAITKTILSGLDEIVAVSVQNLIESGHYIEAIKEYRYWTRCPLVEAKTTIDEAIKILKS